MKLFNVIVLVGVGYAAYRIAKAVHEAQALPLPPPQPQKNPELPSKGPPRLVTGELFLTPGHRYYATVELSFPASTLASDERIRSMAAENGFANVSLSKSRPSFWPGTTPGDYYMMADYQGSPRTFDRNPGPGVHLVEGFEQ